MQTGRGARQHDRARRRRQHPIERRGRRDDQGGIVAARTIAPGAAVSTGWRAVTKPASLPVRTIAPATAVSVMCCVTCSVASLTGQNDRTRRRIEPELAVPVRLVPLSDVPALGYSGHA